jgi:hypothetical protein
MVHVCTTVIGPEHEAGLVRFEEARMLALLRRTMRTRTSCYQAKTEDGVSVAELSSSGVITSLPRDDS